MDKRFAESSFVTLATKDDHLVIQMVKSHSKVVATTPTHGISRDEARLSYWRPSLVIQVEEAHIF